MPFLSQAEDIVMTVVQSENKGNGGNGDQLGGCIPSERGNCWHVGIWVEGSSKTLKRFWISGFYVTILVFNSVNISILKNTLNQIKVMYCLDSACRPSLDFQNMVDISINRALISCQLTDISLFLSQVTQHIRYSHLQTQWRNQGL